MKNEIMKYQELIERFVQENKKILSDYLVGIYLHGSAVMGCFNPQESDLDFLIVVRDTIPDDRKRQYLDMVVRLNSEAPAKGIELSIVKEQDLNPFIYPTPFELHFSIAHLDWYQNSPDDYVKKMKGVDKDLGAHATIIIHRGKMLYGKEIHEVFGPVSDEVYFDSIMYDIESAPVDITEDRMSVILNLCRVLAYRDERLVLSKQEAGEWALKIIPYRYETVIRQALEEYQNEGKVDLSNVLLIEFAGYMLSRITKKERDPLLERLPARMIEAIGNRTCRLLVEAHTSGDAVYKVGEEFILKISSHIDRLLRERDVNDYLDGKVPVSKSVAFDVQDDKGYYLKSCVEGETLIGDYLKEPVQLAKYLAKAMHMLHGIDVTGCTLKNPDSEGFCFVHGDFCLPNILVKDGEISCFIDTEAAGLGDPWIDYAWCIWSYEFNLGTKEYTPILLQELGIDFDQEKFIYYTKGI